MRVQSRLHRGAVRVCATGLSTPTAVGHLQLARTGTGQSAGGSELISLVPALTMGLLALQALLFGRPGGALPGGGWPTLAPIQPATRAVGLFTVALGTAKVASGLVGALLSVLLSLHSVRQRRCVVEQELRDGAHDPGLVVFMEPERVQLFDVIRERHGFGGRNGRRLEGQAQL